MSKKKETEIENFKESIFKKAIDLGFINDIDYKNKLNYILPFGLHNFIGIDFNWGEHLTLDIENESQILEIRKIESPEDLENLFNANDFP